MKRLVFVFIASILFNFQVHAQIKNNVNYKAYFVNLFRLIAEENDSIKLYIHKDELKNCSRLGINYKGEKEKFFISQLPERKLLQQVLNDST